MTPSKNLLQKIEKIAIDFKQAPISIEKAQKNAIDLTLPPKSIALNLKY
jgi:hypothetical protein